MATETMRKLADDVGRLLLAGAHLAPADPALAADRVELEALARKLGTKAPAVAQVAAAIGRALGAGGRDAARELVALATSVAQVRAAQAAPAPAPEGRPLEERAHLGTPCDALALYDLQEALTMPGAGRERKIEQAIADLQIADLRLVDAIIHAMGDPHFGELVSHRAAPLLGGAIAHPIRATLDLKHDSVAQPRRLRALAAVEKEKAKDVLVEAIRTGSAALREAALDAVADFLRGTAELEPLVRETLARERAGGVRRAAVRALAGFGNDDALETLIAALGETASREAAAEALGASTHPRVVDRLLALLDTEPGGAKPAKGGRPASSRGQTLAEAVLTALAPHRDRRIAARALELLEECGVPAAKAVIHGGDAVQLARVADWLDGEAEDRFEVAATAAARLGREEAFVRLSRAMGPSECSGRKQLARMQAATAAIGEDPDPRWVDFLAQEAEIAADYEVTEVAVRALGRLKDRRAVPPLLQHMQSSRESVRRAALAGLGAAGDRSVIGAILAAEMWSGDWMTQWSAREAILALADGSTVHQVRQAVATLGGADERHWSRSLLGVLEQRFPGR